MRDVIIHRLRRLALVAGTTLIAACASTSMQSTWHDPTVGRVAFHRVLVIALTHDASLRRSAEDALAQRITRAEAVPSYTLIPESELTNDEAIRARAQAAGFDGAVVMRVTNVEREATWVPGMYGPYYAYGGWPAYSPGHVAIDTYVRVETNVYSVPDNRLIWASASRTANPSSVRNLVDSAAKAVAKEMHKQGLLP